MQEEHRKAIQKNFTSLVEITDLDSMVFALYEKGVFSEQMIEPYKDTSVLPRDRKRQLYKDIMRRGPKAFGVLLDVLSEHGYWDLVRELDPSSSLHRRSNLNANPKSSLPARSQKNESFLSISTQKNNQKVLQKKLEEQLPAALPPPSLNNNEEAPPAFTVIKSTKFIENDEGKDIKLYRPRERRSRLLLIINYINFMNNLETERNGVEFDSKSLKYLFDEMGFKVLTYNDLTKEETMSTLTSLSSVLMDLECVFVVVSSHGYERSGVSDVDIRCSDNQLISVYTVISYFSNRTMPQLIGVPKIFIFQMCRGSNEDWTYTKPLPLSMPRNVPFEGQMAIQQAVQVDGTPEPSVRAHSLTQQLAELIANLTDTLIVHSTLPGYVSRRSALGSWYIQTLCEVFAERAHDCHVDKLLTLVDQRLQEKFKIQTSSVDRWGFNKRLYLYPGLSL